MSDVILPIDLRRRSDAKLHVSRLAADLFWERGMAATRGEDIAAAAGIATRTLWRYFRSKESCIEPVLTASSRQFLAVLEAWPLDQSIDDYLRRAATPGPVSYSRDDVRAMRMVSLGLEEPSLRSAWLLVCDDAERATWPLIARRTGLPESSIEVRRIAAAVAGAVRALNDGLGVDFVTSGTEPQSADVLAALIASIRDASGGRLGPAVDAPAAASPTP